MVLVPALALGFLGNPLLVPADAAAPPAFKLVARTSHVDYYTVKGGSVDVRQTEAFLERLQSLFGPAPAGWRIQYYRHPSVRDLTDYVGFAVSGVTELATGRIDSSRDFHPHELVHAVTGREGLPPVFFAEGLAVALTSRGLWNGRDMDAVAAAEMAKRGTLEPFLAAFTDQDPDVAYAVAGSFVAFLLERHGIAPMVTFVRGCARSPEAYEGAFRRAYGRFVSRLSIEWMTWLREDARRSTRAWYEPRLWPAALQHEETDTEAARPALAASPPPSTLLAGPVAAEPQPRTTEAGPSPLAVQ
jgi:hypothetical protein